MSNLWQAFVKLLRDCWENNTNLPGFSDDDQLDLSKCLFHQKLQILQFCIATKRKRHSNLDDRQTETEGLKSLSASTSQSNLVSKAEDEFYDASDSIEAETASILTKEPKGRLQKTIFVPLTQDRGPMSEDMIDELTSYLTSLKDGDARTRAQLDILLSDMQAFKAANPGSILADFVRWHSPRDWTETETENGIKKELWESARPIPVNQQARLFNETKEVERILQSFNSILVIDLIHLILPVVVADATLCLINNSAVCFELVKSKLIELCQKVVKFTKRNTVDDIYEIRKDIEHIETTVARYLSLTALFEKQMDDENDESKTMLQTQIQSLIAEMLENEGSKVHQAKTQRVKINDAPRGPLANTILRCISLPFDSSGAVLPKPSSKQYILRWISPRPGIDSRLMTQRMFASIKEEEQEFRLCSPELAKCRHAWTDASFSLTRFGDTPAPAQIYQQIFTSIAICRQLNVPISVAEEIAPTFLQLPAFANAQHIHLMTTSVSQNVVQLMPKQILEWCNREVKPCAHDNNHRKEMIVDVENVKKGLKHLVRLLVKDFESSTKCAPYFLAFGGCAKIPSTTVQLHNDKTEEFFEAFTPNSKEFSSLLENVASLQQFEYIIIRGKPGNESILSSQEEPSSSFRPVID
uniref:Rab3 GTPase-activating protein catalytic subunit n=1 Tax=Ditylenchus dipsaci TaxID=166011 RepID=A0A915DMV4_9BILA